MIATIFPSVSTEVKLERRCPHCGRVGGQIHSRLSGRRISDTKVEQVFQQRLRCAFCGTTWTLHSQGVGPGRQRSDRLIGMGVLLYMLGLSYRAVERFLYAMQWKGSKSGVERDIARAGQKARALHQQAPAMRVRILGVDGTGAKMAGQNTGMLFFTDIEAQQLVCVEPVNETDTKAVRKHVQRVMVLVGAEQLRTDELSVYKHVLDEEDHKICLAHWLKSKCKRAADLARQFCAEGMLYESETMLELKRLLHEKWSLPEVPQEIERLVRRFINCRRGLLWKANQLLQHIERSWHSVSRDPADPTNNVTERIIGLDYKIRTKTMRGFKSWDKALAHPYLSEFIRGTDGLCDLRRVI
jgi:transposase-like protein